MRPLLSICILLLLVSCSRDKVKETASDAESTIVRGLDTAKSRIVAEYDTLSKKVKSASTSTSGVQTCDVILSEYKIEMDETLRAGPVEFKVSNHGTMDHNFEIAGNGVKQSFSPNLQPDEIRVMKLDLKPGVYHVSCPVKQHEAKGMRMQVEVR